ncbi:MAG TPA: MBL fold metallo-hydrolase [Synergistaceae bacterium]|nr:MBL fold metallo-hydrolase [Synergistaceae bacterium]HPJ24815.1 MBL fold metallo-hydrolase [Synergistaceae bacterium]HPQ36254.1 MBL fold metallo-hydrolase [Synergistaceae bacterium]
MILRVLGAAGEVTGSNYLIEVGKSRVLVDFGLHQGRNDDEKNKAPLSFAPDSIDAVLLTHAHLDHTGRVPLLAKSGFRGKIFATSPTVELTQVLWKDSAHIMKEEAEWRSRKNLRKGLPAVEPLYTEDDVENTLQFLRPVSYDDIFEVAPGIKVRCRDAGHILGSANLEVWLQENGEEVKIVFSGDLGPQDTVMERNPAHIEDADYVVIESTYGDRLHKTNLESREEFREVLMDAVRQKSKVLIPTFVVDRAQRVLYEIMLLQKEGELDDNIPIYFDSPMGVKATKIYEKYLPLLSREIQEQIQQGNDPFSPDRLNYVSGVEESRSINNVRQAIVLAGSGMCNGGRIIHHLKHNLWDPTCHVVFVGYQAVGTLGRRLVEGEKYLKMAGEEINVKAQLHTINGFSAHADRRDLLKWAGNFKNSPTFIVTHGEPKSSLALAEGIKELGYRAEVPAPGQEFRLEKGKILPPAAVDFLGEIETPRTIHQESILIEIADIVAALQEEEIPVSAEVLSLLESSKTLLEIVRKNTLAKKEHVH